MAAIEAVKALEATISRSVETGQLTTSRSLPFETALTEPQYPNWEAARIATGSKVESVERGDEELRNSADFRIRDLEADAQETAAENGDSGRVRSELARELLNRVDQLIPLVGEISLATNVQLLKHDLSRCHDKLKGYASESNFLSIVTLIESAMSQLKWKQYTTDQLQLIRSAIDVGYRQPRVQYDDYDQIRQQVQVGRIETTPRIDLEAMPLEDLTDVEEE